MSHFPHSRTAPRLLALGTLVWWSALVAFGCSQSPPSVLIIVIDTLRADHLSVYGYDRKTSPAIDRVATQSTLFENAYSQGSTTVPTHASLFTGRYPHQHGSFGYRSPLPEDEVTLAERMLDAGYRTFGLASSVRFIPESGFDQGFEHYQIFDDLPKNDRSAAVTNRALALIGREPGTPFFGFLHYFDPHQDYAPPFPLRTRWHAGLEEPAPEETGDFLLAHRRPNQMIDPDVLAYLEALYDAEIAYVDREIARLMSGLESLEIDEDVLVILTSDHGEEFKDHGGLSHASGHLHEELVRVPLLMRWPARIPAKRRLAVAVQTVDLVPTILDLLDMKQPPRLLPGRSLAALLLGEDKATPIVGPLFLQQAPRTWAVFDELSAGRWKYSVDHGREPKLFQLDQDPHEFEDLSKQWPRVLTHFEAVAQRLGIRGGKLPLERTRETRQTLPSVESLERLRALGYVDETGSH
jgi:arylsulfatase A-like enzyme